MTIYLDYNATTPVAPQVADAMQPYLHALFGNPSSSHEFGVQAAAGVHKARQQVADLLGAKASEIVFTGCATEANNLAIRGVARALRHKGQHIITSAVEHPAVAEPCKRLREDGYEVSVIPVDTYGRVDPNQVEQAIRPDTVLISIMHANNEVGTIQPITEIARIAKAHGVLLHSDAAQSTGKIPVHVDELGVDLLTIAGHKFYATKGVGALYIRTGTPIEPLIVGAGHENGLRPGTENVPAIVGLGQAAAMAKNTKPEARQHMQAQRDHLHKLLLNATPKLQLNGHPQQRLPNTLNVSFPDIEGRELLQHTQTTLAASVGSACHEDDDAVSGVLGAMGVDATRARGAVRLSLGLMTTDEEIEIVAEALVKAYQDLRL